jgi:subtilisin family serine protease
VLDPLTGLVLGLHFAGAYLESNYAVPAFELSRDSRVVDAGVSFHGSPEQGPVPWRDTWQGHEKTDAPLGASLPTVQVPAQTASVHTFTIPLQISVTLGGSNAGDGVVMSTAPVSPLPGAAGAAPVRNQEQLLSLLRKSQKTGGAGTQRFVLNFASTPGSDDTQLMRKIESTLGLQSHISALFADDPELNRHRLLELSGVPTLERDDLFELARLLRDATQAETNDPDLGSDYFADDGFDRGAGPEGVDFAFWCWAGDDQLPEDPDWAIALTNTPQAWAYSDARSKPSRGQGILVFQPDTGVVPSHSELPKDIAHHPKAINLLEPGQPPIDPMTGGGNPGHGTGTGSVVASPEAGRMRGAAPLATLVPIRCLETVAVFNQSNVARAIDHARRNGAHVITMSLGGVFSDALHSALRKAVQANIIVVAAAGNCVPSVVWPARYEEAIAVGGINERFKPWRGSSHGSAVDISGPAEFVRRANARDSNDLGAVSGGQGTSFATAHLAGVAALWLAHHGREQLLQGLAPGITLQQVFRALVQASARKSAHLDEDEYGAGIVDASGLLKLDPAKAFGLEAVYRAPVHDIRRQVTELLSEALGAGALEAAAPATGDPQNLPELACIALDQLRLARGRRAQVESLPPLAMSAGLRRILGERAQQLGRDGDEDA